MACGFCLNLPGDFPTCLRPECITITSISTISITVSLLTETSFPRARKEPQSERLEQTPKKEKRKEEKEKSSFYFYTLLSVLHSNGIIHLE